MKTIAGQIEMDRRRFLQNAAFATLALQVIPLMRAQAAHADELESDEPKGDNLVVQSSTGLAGHFHSLLVPMADLKDPPENGTSIESTPALFHRHTVELSKEDLVAIASGKTVFKQESSHRFVICLNCS